MSNEEYIRKCYELAISAGKKGHESFGAVYHTVPALARPQRGHFRVVDSLFGDGRRHQALWGKSRHHAVFDSDIYQPGMQFRIPGPQQVVFDRHAGYGTRGTMVGADSQYYRIRGIGNSQQLSQRSHWQAVSL